MTRDDQSQASAPVDVEESQPVQQPGGVSHIGSWARAHVATLGAAGVVVYSAARILVIARGDLSTAAALVESASPSVVLLAGLLQLISAIIPFITALFLVVAAARLGKSIGWTGLALVAAAMGLVLTFLVAPVQYVTLAVPAAIVMLIVVRRTRFDEATPTSSDRRASWAAVVFGMLGFIVSLTITSGPLWAPSELFIINSKSLAGYVLSEDEDWTVILTEERREVTRVQTVDIDERQLCRPKSEGRSVLRFLSPSTEPGYPACSGARSNEREPRTRTSLTPSPPASKGRSRSLQRTHHRSAVRRQRGQRST